MCSKRTESNALPNELCDRTNKYHFLLHVSLFILLVTYVISVHMFFFSLSLFGAHTSHQFGLTVLFIPSAGGRARGLSHGALRRVPRRCSGGRRVRAGQAPATLGASGR